MSAYSAAALGVAVAALAISLVSLWRTQFSKFRLLVTGDTLIVGMQAFRVQDRQWFVIHCTTRVILTNVGVRAGRVMGMRLLVECTDVPGDNTFTLSVYRVGTDDRRPWECGKLSEWGKDWAPIVFSGNDSKEQTTLFTQRMDQPISGNMMIALQLRTDSNREWHSVCEWNLDLTVDALSEMLTGSVYMRQQVDPPEGRRYTFPPRLLDQVKVDIGDLPLAPRFRGGPN